MAKSCAALVAVALFALVGCQPEQPAVMVRTLPPPNFDGPMDLTSQPPVATLPPRALPPAGLPKELAGDVPAGWVPPIRANSWKWIVIHHSATVKGGAAMFDRIHKDKGWDELGYHFVVGNGTDTRDGHVEVGPRWKKQKWGAHAKTPDNKYNEFGIGVCLVGNFDLGKPSWKQTEATAKLVAYLQQTYNVPSSRVIGHGTVKTMDSHGTATHCPGKQLDIAQIRKMSTRIMAASGGPVPAAQTASATENLLYDTNGG